MDTARNWEEDSEGSGVAWPGLAPGHGRLLRPILPWECPLPQPLEHIPGAQLKQLSHPCRPGGPLPVADGRHLSLWPPSLTVAPLTPRVGRALLSWPGLWSNHSGTFYCWREADWGASSNQEP